MTPERWSQVEGLFLQAVEMRRRNAETFLDQACGGDACSSRRSELAAGVRCA